MSALTQSRLPLHDAGIVVTRPLRQADELCRLIEAQGGKPIRFPTLAIQPVPANHRVAAIIDRLEQYAMAIFVSANAVDYALAAIHDRRDRLPTTLLRVAIGQGTARALARWNLPAQSLPPRFNSEALLALPVMQTVAGQRIVIFQGQDGRDLLADSLTQRGAWVERAEVYRRVRPEVSATALLEHWARDEIQAIVVTSNAGLQNLFDIVGPAGQTRLRQTRLIAVSQRAVALARELGFVQPPVVTREAGDQAILEALLTHFTAASPE